MSRTVISALLLFVVPLASCMGDGEPGVMAGVDSCLQCGMVIDRVNQSCGFSEEGEFLTFDSPGCLLEAYEKRRGNKTVPPSKIYFADYHDAGFHSAESATFLLTEHVPTVMNAGVLAFASQSAAEKVRSHPDEHLTDWNGYRTARGTPDQAVAVTIERMGMSPEVVEVDKGDLISLRLNGTNLEADLLLRITGYPELGTIAVPATGEEIEVRVLALRPGDGFPIIDEVSGEALGRLKVHGPHTQDEEEM